MRPGGRYTKAFVWHGKEDFRCDAVPASDITK
jgi:hypothetical protein